MDYWPRYDSITAQARGAYLAWLAGGRKNPRAYIGYVFLFFYGLERRLLVDRPVSDTESDQLIAEIRRLYSVYRHNRSFSGYASRLLAALEVLSPRNKMNEAPPDIEDSASEMPIALRVGLGQFVAAGKPIPTNWALAWQGAHPDGYRRTPASRCPDEFTEMFSHLYRKAFGAGMVIKPNKSRLTAAYRPASSGIPAVGITNPGLPDVAALTAPLKRLQETVNSATDALDAYSRYLGRHPDGARSPAALALLPDGLTHRPDPQTEELWAWAGRRLGSVDSVLVPVSDLVDRWPGSGPRLTKADALAIAQLLDKRGFGIEPDVRFGGAVPPANGQVALFRRGSDRVTAPCLEYPLAVAMVNVGAAVAIADGTVTEPERRVIRERVVARLDLSDDEQRRLNAHTALVLANPPSPAVLRRRLSSVPEHDRNLIAHLLTEVAAADGDVSVHEVRTLERLYTTLGLDVGEVYGNLHTRVTGTVEIPTDEPVPVRIAGSQAARVHIPQRTKPAPNFSSGLALDAAALTRKRAESLRVSDQLAEIFAEQEDQPLPARQEISASPGVAMIAGLDGDHTRLFDQLIGQPAWSRAELEALADQVGLMLDGALDVINEAALDIVGDPVWEGADPVQINNDVAEEMRS